MHFSSYPESNYQNKIVVNFRPNFSEGSCISKYFVRSNLVRRIMSLFSFVSFILNVE